MNISTMITVSSPADKQVKGLVSAKMEDGFVIIDFNDLTFSSFTDEFDVEHDDSAIKEMLTYAIVEGRVIEDTWECGLSFKLNMDVVAILEKV